MKILFEIYHDIFLTKSFVQKIFINIGFKGKLQFIINKELCFEKIISIPPRISPFLSQEVSSFLKYLNFDFLK